MNVTLATKIFSTLNNSASPVQLGIKDAIDLSGRTYMASKESGAHEARERFIEEVGTSAVWLGGIPLLRKVYDKTVFKAAGLNPKIDLKLITNKKGHQSLEKALETAEGTAKKELEKIVKNKKLYKNLHIGKMIVSTVLPLYVLARLLPKLNFKLSKKKVQEDILGKDLYEKSGLSFQSQSYSQRLMKAKAKKNLTFAAFTQYSEPKKVVSFGGAGKFISGIKDAFNPLKAAQAVQVNPVDNMLALDAGITGGRLANSRDKNELAEIGIREGGIIYFMFLGGKHIAKALENVANNVFNTPINLDPKIADSNDFIGLIEKSKTDSKFLGFAPEKTEESILKFIKGELKTNFKDGKFNNFTLESARKQGLLKLENNKLDPYKYIDTKKIASLNDDIKNFVDKAIKSGKPVESFVKKAKHIKRGSIVANMAICSTALAFVVPKLQYLYREKVTGTNLPPGHKGYREEALEIKKKMIKA